MCCRSKDSNYFRLNGKGKLIWKILIWLFHHSSSAISLSLPTKRQKALYLTGNLSFKTVKRCFLLKTSKQYFLASFCTSNGEKYSRCIEGVGRSFSSFCSFSSIKHCTSFPWRYLEYQFWSELAAMDVYDNLAINWQMAWRLDWFVFRVSWINVMTSRDE